MANREPFAVGEWYHCFSRGIEKRNTFGNDYDANRFLMLLYLANGTKAVSLFGLRKLNLEKVFGMDRGEPLVDIGAYCLMPNHFHLLIKEKKEGGISAFMRKLGIAYTMYFNSKHERVGNLFVKPFRSRHIATDRYFQRVLQYIHCNPAELYEEKWKAGVVKNERLLELKLREYPYVSLAAHLEPSRHDAILSREVFKVANPLPLRRMLEEARSYYRDIAEERFER